MGKIRRRRGSKKLKQHSHNLLTGKYKKQFYRTLKRTGKWRGKKYI